MDKARAALQQYFGFDDFRKPQDAVIQTILEGKDTLVIMPTGGGKSLCYQLPALLLDGVTLVISPLIALMKDQVDALQARGIAAAMVNSSQSWEEQKSVLEAMRRQELKLVYISPERFRAGSFLNALGSVKIAMLAIDEAHCISQWGHDFRPDYHRLGEVLKSLGHPPCTAFTATATPEVRDDIQTQLGLDNPAVFVAGFSRPNLSFRVTELKRKIDKSIRLRKLIAQHRTGIIYCATRKSVEAVSAELSEDDIIHCAYHAGLSKADRDANQDAFIRGEVPVAVATSAFGMGIDRADIRFVCHYEMPGSVEAYYQEAGRAGRDGKASVCEMFFMYADKRVQDFFVEGANPEIPKIHEAYDYIRNYADEDHCVSFALDDISEALPGKNNPMAIHTAIGHLVRHGYLERFDIPGSRTRGTRLLQPQLASRELKLPLADLREKKRRDESKLNAVIQMAYAKDCRQTWMLRYFGEADAHDCGRCDACQRSSHARELDESETNIVLKALSGVARMSQKRSRYEWEPQYGRKRIQNCLLGKADIKLAQANLDQLPTYGILQDLGAPFVEQLFDALLEAGLVAIVDGQYPLLKMTHEGVRVMFREVAPRLEWPEDTAAQKSGTKKKRASLSPETAAHSDLYKQLTALRNKMRNERNVPAYTIFPNTVLQKLADQQPQTAEDAMTIKGIGPTKATSILPAFLEIIKAHAK